jgi:serine/threonine protein kinase
MPLNAGDRLGPYEILNLIGAGGMGEVYRARDPRLGRFVAIKVLPATYAAEPDRLRRFEQEARAASALSHPAILTIHDVGHDQGIAYLVSELLEGDSLRHLVSEGPIPTRKAIDFARQIARGLAAAHQAGIIHRDLKPENVFATRGGRIKILDFGLAKLKGDATSDLATATSPAVITDAGHVLGTSGYMSPEQVRGEAVDSRSDVFAFGALLHEMLTGRRAFSGPSSIETMTAVLREEPPSPSSLATGIPPALDRIVGRCLEKRPDDRFQSTSDLAFALEALSDSLPPTQATGAALTLRNRRRAWIVPAAVTGTALAMVLGWRFGWFRALRATDAPTETDFIERQVTTNSSDHAVDSAAISPDGKYVVYADVSAIYLRLIETGETRTLPVPAGLCFT